MDRKSLALLGITSLNVALFVTFLILRIIQPSDGFRLPVGEQVVVDGGLIVEPLGPVRGELRQGDIVTAMAGRRIESWVDDLLCPAPFCAAPARPPRNMGDTLTYTVLRGGQEQQVSVMLGRYPLGANLAADWGPFVTALVYFGVGVFVFTQRPNEPAARILLLIGSSNLSTETWTMGLQVMDFIYPLTFWLYWVTTGWVYLLLWIGILHFALVFPNPHRIVKRNPRLIPLIYILPFVVHALTVVVTGLTVGGDLAWYLSSGVDGALTTSTYGLLAVLAMVTNYRAQTDHISRRQIQIIVFAALVVTVTIVLLQQVPRLVLGQQLLPSGALALVALLLPFSVAVSILRYRLWNIDLIIRRTLQYSAVTAVLGLTYFGSIVLLQAIFRGATGSSSSIAIVISTLVIAALFNPLRLRIQRVVDRRFFRANYDAQQTLEHFSEQLRDEVNLDDMRQMLFGVVNETIQPDSVSLWLATAHNSGSKTVQKDQ